MAETVVNILLQSLSAFLSEEISLQRGARENFEEIKRELHIMRAFLRDADKKKDSSDVLKVWVGEVRNATFTVEDIIDEFIYSMNLQRSQRSTTTGCTYYILKTIHLPKMIYYKHQLATQLQEAKTQIAAISRRKDQYQLAQAEDVASYNNDIERLKRSNVISAFKDSSEIVGLEDKTNELVEWLTSDDPERKAIAVVGMGGMGKTTLVAQAFKHEKVKQHLHCFARICVSQSYKVEELLKAMIIDLKCAKKSNLNGMDYGQLLKEVKDYLVMKRYVIVVDDVWRAEAWKDLEVAFPWNEHGSRIMLTTRKDDVAAVLGRGGRIYQLRPLQDEAAWDLFNKNAFWEEPCPRDLEPLARSMVEKCQGLPLAIVNLGSLLSLREQTVAEWTKVHDDVNTELAENETIKSILLLSYYDLPYNLMPCFLYCCLFPEDHLIKSKLITRLWVAEGFVEERRKRITLEEAAEECLKELVHRNMLQEEVDFTLTGTKFRVHDLVREVGLSVLEEEKFCCLINNNTSDEYRAQGDEMLRRVAIHVLCEDETIQLLMEQQQQRMRSFLMFDEFMPTLYFPSLRNMMAEFSSSNSLRNMMAVKFSSSYRSIRVLHLDRAPIERLPNEVTELFNLRYLSLRYTQIRELPKSFGKLTNLQTLDVRNTDVDSLPRGIRKLQKLRHLMGYQYIDTVFGTFDYFSGIKIPPQLCHITSLQTLYNIEATGEMAKHLGNLTQLKKLKILKVRKSDGVELCTSISKMKRLDHLWVKATDEQEAIELEALSRSPPPSLHKLQLQGHLEKAPQWLGALPNLTHLTLMWSGLRNEELNGFLLALSGLSSLVLLRLHKTFQEDHQVQFRFQNGWLPKLQQLILGELTGLNQVLIEKGAMPSLQTLELVDCPELKTLPQGIEHLAHLRAISLLGMPVECHVALKELGHGELE